MVQVLTAEAARLLVEGLQARDLPPSKGKSKVVVNGTDKLKHDLLQQLEVLGIDECDTARNVEADLQQGQAAAGARRQGAAGKASEAHEAQLRKAGAHTRNLTLTGPYAGVLWGSEVLGFTSTQLQAIRVNAAKATCRLSRGQNAATTMMPHAQAAGAKNVDPAFRHHRQVVLAWVAVLWEGPPHHAGAARYHCQAQPPQEPVVRRHGCGSHFRAHVAAAGPECSVGQAPHHPRWHDDRSLGGGAQDSGFLGRPDFADVVRQFCPMGQFKRATFLGSRPTASCFLASWKGGRSGIETCWSSWFRVAFGHKIGFLDFEAGTTIAASSATTAQALCSTTATSAPPCRRVGHASIAGGAAGGTVS